MTQDVVGHGTATWPSERVKAALQADLAELQLRKDLKGRHGSHDRWRWPSELESASAAPRGEGGVQAWEDARRAQAAQWAEDLTAAGAPLCPASPGRVLLAGDWHGNVAWAVTCLMAASRLGARVIAQVGDFGVWPGGSGQHYLDVVSDAATRLDLTVVFVDGNHEDFEQLERTPVHAGGWRVLRPRLLHAPRAHTWTWGVQRWVGFGGATSLDRPHRTPLRDWWPQEEITAADLYRLQATMTGVGGPVDVLLTHDAPSAVTIPGLDPHGFTAPERHRAAQHRLLLDEAVELTHPTLLVHGHFHQAHREVVELADGHRYTSLSLDLDGTGERSLHLLDTDEGLGAA